MQDDDWNLLSYVFGGREGCFAFLYTEPGSRSVRREARRVLRNTAELDRECLVIANDLKRYKQRIQTAAEQQRREEAERYAIELQQVRVKYRRVGAQKDKLRRIYDQLTEQLRSTDIDHGLMLVCKIMQQRYRTMHPQRFQQMMMRYERARMQHDTMEDALQEFWQEDEDRDLDRAERESSTSNEQIQAVFSEFNIQFPDDRPVASHMLTSLEAIQPPSHRPS